MRQGNILEGIRAGFQSYMQTRQWGAGMQTNKLAQEQMTMANRMQEQRNADYMSPEAQAEFNRTNQEAALRGRLGIQEEYDVRAGEREAETFRNRVAEMDALGRDPYGRPLASGGGGQEPYTFKGSEPVYDYFNTIAVNAGLPSISAETMDEIQG